MAKRNKKATPTTSHPVVAVSVHPSAVNPTAFKLGFYHGFEGARRKPNFIYQSTATAYALGKMAGCAARAAQA
mgnify:CR=1 FL=1